MSGLQFKKLDLHIHTPASKDFHKPKDKSDAEIAQIIVQKAIERGLDGIAITDHNSGNWIDIIKNVAKGTNLVVFPGVEITCSGGSGIHVIAIFDPLKTKDHINTLLSRLGLNPEEYGIETAVVNKSPMDVIDEISNIDALPILAHINSTNGVFVEMEGIPRLNVIQNMKLVAAECTDYFNEEKKNKGKRAIDFLNGKDPNYKRKLAVYQASDNPVNISSHGHCIDGIGNRYAYFKMEEINLISLKNCFEDSDVRIRFILEDNENIYPKIKNIKVTGGFLDGIELSFHEGLNSIIGSKGSGKSLLIEFLRFVFNQSPTNSVIYEDHRGKLENRLKLYGEIEVQFEIGKENIQTIKRQYDPSNDNPYVDENIYDISRIFPVIFLSQNEIIKIAENEDDQLTFIDRFFDFREFINKINGFEKELKNLDKSFSIAIESYIEAKELESKFKTKEMELAEVDQKLKNPIFDKFSKSESYQQNILNFKSYLNSLKSRIGNAKKIFSDVPHPKFSDVIASEPLFKRLKDILTETKDNVDIQFENIESKLDDSLREINIETQEANISHKITLEEYETFVKSSGGNYQTLAGKRQILNKELNELRQKLNGHIEKSEKLKDISNSRKELLDQIEKQRKEYTDKRKEKCLMFENESCNKLKVTIKESSNVVDFKNRLLKLKKGSYLRDSDIETICNSISPREFIHNIIRYLIVHKTSTLKPIVDMVNIEESKIVALSDFLLEEYSLEELLEMQYKVTLQDKPLIQYLLESGNYSPLSELSTGQKSTALLIMALSEGNMPIVIDQPEDSLDLKTVWSDVCQKLRNGKEKRQFIFTTHNSSVAVASDSDSFMILESNAIKGELKFQGALDNNPINNEVIDYLEGGIDTYRLKMKKYNILIQ